MRRHVSPRALLAAAAVSVLAGCGAHVMPEIRTEQERLATARRMVQERHHADAIELLKAYVSGAAGQAQVDEAIYLLGVSYLETRQYPLAQGEFERLVRDYPESDSAGAGAFRLGEALLGQSRPRDFDQEYTERAVEQWQNYLQLYPGHWLNAEAERRVLLGRTRLGRKMVDAGNLYVKLRQWEPARVYFERVIANYGDTPAAPEADLGLARLDARQGRRSEAIERLRAIEARWAGQAVAREAAKERARLDKSS